MKKSLSEKTWDKIMNGIMLGGVIASAFLAQHYTQKNQTEYTKMFMKEADKSLTKGDSIAFYKVHGLEKYAIYENPLDTTKTFDEHIKFKKVPYKKIRRIVKEYNKQNDRRKL